MVIYIRTHIPQKCQILAAVANLASPSDTVTPTTQSIWSQLPHFDGISAQIYPSYLNYYFYNNVPRPLLFGVIL